MGRVNILPRRDLYCRLGGAVTLLICPAAPGWLGREGKGRVPAPAAAVWVSPLLIRWCSCCDINTAVVAYVALRATILLTYDAPSWQQLCKERTTGFTFEMWHCCWS